MDPLDTKDEQSWAAALAARLRLIQSSGVDDPPATRRQHLAEEVERALEGLSASKRSQYLTALEELFPTWQTVAVAAAASPPEEETVDLVVEKLLARLPELTDGQKARLADALGVQAPAESGDGLKVDFSECLPEALGWEGDKAVDCGRAARLMTSLLALVVHLDQPLWYTWKQLVPRSDMRGSVGDVSDLKVALKDFLSGGDKVTDKELAAAFDARRSLLAGLLAAVGGAPQLYARRYLERLSPEAIREAVEMQRRSPWRSFEVVCWDKFVELSAEYGSEAAIEKAIRSAVARFTEQVVKGRLADSES